MTTITEVVPGLGSVPTTADPTTFDSRADTLLGTSLPATVTSINTWAGQVNTVAGEVNANALVAASGATSASTAIATANFAGVWASLTGALAVPSSVEHNGTIWILLNNLADVTASEPGVTADWSPFNQFTVDERTANAIITALDIGKVIDITANSFTQTWDAVANLGVGFYVHIKNSGTGDITHDFDGSETCDALTSFVQYPGEMRTFMLNAAGTALKSFVVTPFKKSFLASGTFTKPPGYLQFGGILWGAGSSGQRTNNASTISSGGGGGGAFPFTIDSSLIGSTETVTIGAGGASVTTVANGNVGGDTSLGSLFKVWGNSTFYQGGAVGKTVALQANGDATTFGYISSTTIPTAFSLWGGAASSSDGSAVSGSSLYAGGAGGSLDASATLRAAGTSINGGDGGAASSASNGTDGTQPGGGGGATQTGTQSGAGGDGALEIWGVC